MSTTGKGRSTMLAGGLLGVVLLGGSAQAYICDGTNPTGAAGATVTR